MIYGYARVSTTKQKTDGNSLEDQEEKLREAGCTEVYQEAYTGTKMSRPEFDKVLALLGPGDTLVVTKLDRISRTAEEGGMIIKGLLERGVSVRILNMGLLDTTPTGMLMMHMLLAFAEFERDMIVERTQAGRAVARTKEGYREGRKPKKLPELARYRAKVSAGEMTVIEACAAMGISRRTWYNKVA